MPVHMIGSFTVRACSNPECGIHIVLLDSKDNPVTELALDAVSTRTLIKYLQDCLYEQATEKKG